MRKVSAFILAAVFAFALFGCVKEPRGTTLRQGAPSMRGGTQDTVIDTTRASRSPGERDGRVICIDAGHGGKDPGTMSGDRQEKNDTLRLALLVEEYLTDAGFTVVMTRRDDTYPTLSERCDIANEAGAYYFVSLHRNSAPGAFGTEVWVSKNKPREDKLLAQTILDALKVVGISRDRGVCFGSAGDPKTDLFVNSHTEMPSCLVELGFVNDERDNRDFDEKLDAYAHAIADAIVSLMP